MSLQLLLLLCLSVVHLCMGDQPVEEVIIKKERLPLLGGWNEMNPDSADVQEAAQYAVTMFNNKCKSKRLFKLLNITAAHNQVTNVINYKIDAVLGKTKCLKSENHDLKSCSLGKRNLKCQFKVALELRNQTHHLDTQKCWKFEEKV
uniref:Cystatin domain-containing protein n=1 Tax=Monopterus albus TaxID=43700 RepID=A0A3Q3J6K7_MONAL|nr:L-cystatin-like [Monopterus albus]